MEKKEAMKILKDFHDKSALFSVRTALDTIIPELCESKDEKIRKAIIKLVRQSSEVLDKQNQNNMIAWLEKQGEQKSSDKPKFEIGDEIKMDNEDSLTITKIDEQGYWSGDLFICSFEDSEKWNLVGKVIKPKFKIGDWITNDDYTWKIVEVKPLDYILQSQDGNIVDDAISYVDEQFHSFTIDDAKDGDVLASELCDSIILFRGIKDDNIDFYCDYDFSKIDIPGDRFTVNNGQHYGNVEDSKDFYPATKEQRDLLFQKMHEAGYTFDFEKKELKKIDDLDAEKIVQHLAWCEEDKKIREVLIYYFNKYKEQEECDINTFFGVPIDNILDWLKNQGEQTKIEAFRTEYEKGRADAYCEMKKDWSKEDEWLLESTIAFIEANNTFCSWKGKSKKDILPWLKSLKQRIGG